MSDIPDCEITRLIDSIANEYEANWLPDLPNDIGPYLDRIAEEHRSRLLKCLINVDFELRQKANSPATPDTYLEFGDLDDEQVLEFETDDFDATAPLSNRDKVYGSAQESSAGDRVRYFGEFKLSRQLEFTNDQVAANWGEMPRKSITIK